MARLVALLLLCAVAQVGVALPAHAHNVLIGSDPKDGAEIATAPTEVTLVFDQPVRRGYAQVSVTGPGGTRWTVGEAKVRGERVVAGVEPLGPAGEYVVGYRILSSDGHPVSGKVTFTLTVPGPAAGPAAGPATGPATAPRDGGRDGETPQDDHDRRVGQEGDVPATGPSGNPSPADAAATAGPSESPAQTSAQSPAADAQPGTGPGAGPGTGAGPGADPSAEAAELSARAAEAAQNGGAGMAVVWITAALVLLAAATAVAMRRSASDRRPQDGAGA